MDTYTRDTRNWLDQRFCMTDAGGIYFAHQPIYGFRKGPCEPGFVERYIVTYQIMKALSHLTFRSLLDVGGAEGYKAALAREIFGANIKCCDLSKEACRRAKEIFNAEGLSLDIKQLPFRDNAFDVVLCSETLEHVPNLEAATRELKRVCKKAVVITVPHESKNQIEKYRRENILHAHLHPLDTGSFDFISSKVLTIIVGKMLSPLLKMPSALINATLKDKTSRYPELLTRLFNRCIPAFRILFKEKATIGLMNLDHFLSNRINTYRGMLFIILKDESCYSKRRLKKICPRRILEFSVPSHFLR